MRTIQIDFPPTGEVSIEAIGFKGPDCEKFTEAFEQALGKVSTKKKKPEYHAQAIMTAKQRA